MNGVSQMSAQQATGPVLRYCVRLMYIPELRYAVKNMAKGL
jgi:hypothetical protein